MAPFDKSQDNGNVQAPATSAVRQALVEIRRLRAELEACRSSQREPIAILGMAVRLPGGITTPERFWEALTQGEDLIGTVPPARWDSAAFSSTDPDEAGTMYDIHGGFLSDVDGFDAEFFGIHAREAASMDPQQRLLLELTWEALERSAVDPRSLMNSQTGIWLGLANSDYARRLLDDPRRIDGYTGVGMAGSIAAGRIAYFLGTHGPAEVIDTACSSSLVAVHHAVRSLRRGETDLAIVGAANLMLSPELHICFSRTGMLSRTGRCRTFDAAADGYVRAEACCVIVLKRLADAEREGDPVRAVIRGSAVNQDGRSAGITAPNGPAQEAVMRAALADADLQPTRIGYLEAHGTGTPLGDPMEFRALGAVYGPGRPFADVLRVGSVKTNLGHTEAAAGLTGLIKVALMLQPGHAIPPHLHCATPSPQIDWQRWPIDVPTSLTLWPETIQPRCAAVSSFGFSGTNAHVILAEPPAHREEPEAALPRHESLLCLSAEDESALHELALRYASFLRTATEGFEDICISAATTRARLPHRVALRAWSAAEAAAQLEDWLAGRKSPGVFTRETVSAGSVTDGDSLDAAARSFMAGGGTPYGERTATAAHVQLPLYPFQRRRCWFGESPLVQRRSERDRVWQTLCTAMERQSLHGPLDWSPRDYPERWGVLERLTLAHAHNVLAETGVFLRGEPATLDQIMQSCGFLPVYRRLVLRWLRGLSAQGVLRHGDGRFSPAAPFGPAAFEPLWDEAEQCLRDEAGLLAYLRRCGALLRSVLTGQVSALETLFPEGSFTLAEALYENGPAARYSNSVVAAGVQAAVQGWGRRRNVRILELGGGTGGTTSAILPTLDPGHTEYWFSDVSESFLNRARQKFRDYSFVRYTLFDLDSDLAEQSLPANRFDVVVAANVVHAMRNLPAALRRIQRLLAPGGVLILLETTTHHAWFDMSIGLIEGWQHFEGDERGEHPLLSAQQWRDILARGGFEEPTSLPRDDSSAASFGQHVLFARRPCIADTATEVSAACTSVSAQRVPEPSMRAASELPARNDFPGEASAENIPLLVREIICRVLRLETPAPELDDRDRLSDLGMDSLIALELRGELARALGLEGRISSTIAFDTGTIGALTESLITALRPSADKPAPRTEGASATAGVRPVLSAEALHAMTEEQVEELLKERLSRR